MKLEKQIEKIIKDMFWGPYIQNNTASRGPNRYLAPLTLTFETFEAMHYLYSIRNITSFLTDCQTEMKIYMEQTLTTSTQTYKDLLNHKFWKKENNKDLAIGYMTLMKDAFDLSFKKNSRNNVATNDKTCISYIQEICGNLVVVSRSCDFSLGFLADLYLIYNIARENNCSTITWTHANLHVYDNNITKSYEQYTTKIKYDKFNFNVR